MRIASVDFALFRHAFVGCHLKETTFLEAFEDDLQAVRKRVELDDLVVWETTLATDGSNANFNIAENSAKKRLADDESFVGVLDVRRARLEQIRPLPLKRGNGDALEIDFDAEKTAASDLRTSTDAARPLLPEIETPLEVLTPKNRVERWKQNLLDLTLRNKLLNCKEKQTVSILPPDARLSETLERLSEGKRFLIRPAQSILKADSLRDFGAVERRKGVDVPQAVLKESVKNGVLFAKPEIEEEELQKRLTKIYRDARAGLNEGDVNTLFLVLGVVERVADRDGKKYRAPLLLIPVEITQLSKKKGFVVEASGDEARLNATLFELLRRDFEKEIRGLDPSAELPTTKGGIVDVETIFQIFRRELLDLEGWELKNEICLGNFSFQKFVMWSNLNEHMDELEKTPLVRHLIYTPKERFDDGVEEIKADGVDSVAVDEIIAPLSADSSQLAALLNAAAGKNFVLQGPPGTGKSQTIANIIAHCLAEGKSTLFVSEKRAALDVVYRRLCGLGLAPFCLELHSNKTGKRQVLDQLRGALEFSEETQVKNWTNVNDEIEYLKEELNKYVDELRRVWPNGQTLYQAFATLINLETYQEKAARFLGTEQDSSGGSWARNQTGLDAYSDMPEEEFYRLLNLGEEATVVLANVPKIAWTDALDFGATKWSPRWNREVGEVARKICDVESSFRSNFALLAELTPGLALGVDVDRWRSIVNLTDAISQIKSPTPRGLYSKTWEKTEAKIRRWAMLNDRMEEARVELERIDARRFSTLCGASLAERTASRGGLRFGAFDFNRVDADAWLGGVFEVASERRLRERCVELGDVVKALKSAFAVVAKRLNWNALKFDDSIGCVSERRVGELVEILETLRSNPAPARALLSGDWNDFASRTRDFAELGRRREAEAKRLVGLDVERLLAFQFPQNAAGEPLRTIAPGLFALRSVRVDAETEEAQDGVKKEGAPENTASENERTQDDAASQNDFRAELDRFLQTLDAAVQNGTETFGLFKLNNRFDERAAAIWRPLLSALTTEPAPPTERFLARDWERFSATARRLIELAQTRDALAKQIEDYDAAKLAQFDAAQAEIDGASVPKGVFALRNIRKNNGLSFVAPTFDELETEAPNEEKRGAFADALSVFLPTVNELAEATASLARRLKLNDANEETAALLRRLLDEAKGTAAPSSAFLASDWNDFSSRLRAASVVGRARLDLFDDVSESELNEIDDFKFSSFEENALAEARRIGKRRSEIALRFAETATTLSREEAANGWEEIARTWRETFEVEREITDEIKALDATLAGFEPDAVLRFDVAEVKRQYEATAKTFFLFRAKGKKKIVAALASVAKLEFSEAVKRLKFKDYAEILNAIERRGDCERRRGELREKLDALGESWRETLEREKQLWDESRRNWASDRKRWGRLNADWPTFSDWSELDGASKTAERLIEIATKGIDDAATRERVLNAVGEFWFDLSDKKSSMDNKDDAAPTLETQERNNENDATSLFSAFDFFNETNASEPCETVDDAASLPLGIDSTDSPEISAACAGVSFVESAARTEARRFDEVWARFETRRESFLRTFVAWKDEFERSQRDVVSTVENFAGRLGGLANPNGRVDVDSLSRSLTAGDKIAESVRTTLVGAVAKQIPATLDFLGKHWRSVFEEGSEKGGALRRWLESWTRVEEGIERFAERLTDWQNERRAQDVEFEELASLCRSRFEAERPNAWRDLDNAVDVGDLVFRRVVERWGAEIERDSLVRERFWSDLNQLWSELSDETSAICVGAKRCRAVWNEYSKRLAAFAVALNEPATSEGGLENAADRTFSVGEARTKTTDGANENDGANSQICELNVFIDWVYRFETARVEARRIENELGPSASVLLANDGRRDSNAALRTVEELAEFDRRVCVWKFPLGVDVLRDRVGAALANSFENGNKELFAERSETVRGAWNEFRSLQSRLDKLTAYRGATFDDSKADDYLANWRRVAERALRCENVFQYWSRWNRTQEKLAQDFPDVVEAIRKREIDDADVAPILRYLLFTRFADEVVDASETLRCFVGSERDRQVERFRELDERRAELTKRFVVSELARRSPTSRIENLQLSGEELGAWTFLKREIGLKRHTRSIRQILDAIQPILPTLKPCLLMSPLSVAQYMPADSEKRDVIIFDEASQMPVWDAVGAIARGSQLIVVGDSKQLPPTSFFKRRLDEEELDEEEVEETESVLDECVAAHIPTTMLTWHYRSRRESLIAFSNRRYYDGKLQTFPAPKDDALGVRFRYVADGVYEKGGSKTNKPEAEALVNAVVERLRSPEFAGKSLGVVTFNEAQKHLIEDLLDDARRKYPQIETFFDESALEPVFVKNLENVQGDERDVIYFSICYGPDAKGAISMNFGPLNVDGGERRLNVAITRAKEENVVFSSIRSADISLSRTRKKGPSDLKAFLEYAESGGRILAETALNEGVRAADDFTFEREIAEFLRSKGYEVDERVGTSQRRVDLAVVSINKETGEREYVAAIECDGSTYASAETARDRDVLRSQVLENLGWRAIRVWSTAWLYEREKTEAKLLRELQTAFIDFANEREKRAEQNASASVARVETELEADVDDYDLELDEEPSEWATQCRASESCRFASSSLSTSRLFRSESTETDENQRPYPSCDYSTLGTFAIKPAEGEAFHERLHDRAFRALLQKQMREIIAREAPITERLLFQRIREYWGFSRAGAQIAKTLRDATPSDILSTADADGERVFWRADQDPRTYRYYRVSTTDSNPRDFGDVPTVELANALKAALDEANGGRFDEDEVFRNALKKLGFHRLSQQCGARLRATLRKSATDR